MRTAFEEEEDEIADRHEEDSRGDHGEDRELTISSTTLLAVFFGLVLLCGLFFGLGYTLGRRTASDAGQLASTVPATTNLQPSTGAAKPSAASQPAAPPVADSEASQPAADTTASTASADTSADPSQAKTPETAPAPAPQVVKAALPQASPAPVSTAPVSAPVAAAAAQAGIMVQIAAISNPADADVLVGALQKRGYSVATHRFPGDPLIHVQVGPFTNRADAIAMRQKLLSDGYNAILK